MQHTSASNKLEQAEELLPGMFLNIEGQVYIKFDSANYTAILGDLVAQAVKGSPEKWAGQVP